MKPNSTESDAPRRQGLLLALSLVVGIGCFLGLQWIGGRVVEATRPPVPVPTAPAEVPGRDDVEANSPPRPSSGEIVPATGPPSERWVDNPEVVTAPEEIEAIRQNPSSVWCPAGQGDWLGYANLGREAPDGEVWVAPEPVTVRSSFPEGEVRCTLPEGVQLRVGVPTADDAGEFWATVAPFIP